MQGAGVAHRNCHMRLRMRAVRSGGMIRASAPFTFDIMSYIRTCRRLILASLNGQLFLACEQYWTS